MTDYFLLVLLKSTIKFLYLFILDNPDLRTDAGDEMLVMADHKRSSAEALQRIR